MEITSLYSQQPLTLETGMEDRVAASRQSAPEVQNPVQENDTTAADRVELVRNQNLASPTPENVDMDQALALLQQVQQDLGSSSRDDLQGLYNFDRLRDLCAQVQLTEF